MQVVLDEGDHEAQDDSRRFLARRPTTLAAAAHDEGFVRCEWQ